MNIKDMKQWRCHKKTRCAGALIALFFMVGCQAVSLETLSSASMIGKKVYQSVSKVRDVETHDRAAVELAKIYCLLNVNPAQSESYSPEKAIKLSNDMKITPAIVERAKAIIKIQGCQNDKKN